MIFGGGFVLSNISRVTVVSIFGLLLAGMASTSNATIYNISATSGVGLDVTLDPGQYLLRWVGVADGGLYDAWNGNCPTGACDGGWTNSFNAVDLPVTGGDFTLELFGNGPAHNSALASLSAIQSAASINHGQIEFTGGVAGAFTSLAPIAQPWIVDGGGSFRLLVGDGSPGNNFGGVSLSLTSVPEPAAWAMMLVGFGGLGAALRRQRRQNLASPA
jgi:hypothetical protein